MTEWDELILVGRVARPHGLRGEVIVNPESDFAEERFQPGRELYLRRGERVEAAAIEAVRFHRGRPIVALAGVHDVGAARELASAELRVALETLSPLPGQTYYRHDLVGCTVRTVSGELVGSVAGVEGARDGSRLVVAAEGVEVLVPLAADICVQIDVPGRRIVIDPPEGLLDLNA
jgi:16S rRNA processing protein RimM